MDKVSKESYAMMLGEQIAARKLQHASNDVDAPSLIEDDRPPLARLMGQRHGGPMPPPQKDGYASALRAQIAARDALREEAAVERAASVDVAGLGLGLGVAKDGVAKDAFALGRGRRHGPPLLPTKENYAVTLQEQMAARSVQQAADAAAAAKEPADCDGDVLDEVLAGKGRCHGGPCVPPAKHLYAAELEEQIAERRLQQASQKGTESEPSAPSKDFFSEQAERARGKRPVWEINQVAKSSYNTVLQSQMAERAAQRAANAYHLEAGSASPVEAEQPSGGRRRGELPPTSKQSYAQALQEQVAQRKAQEAHDKSAGPAQAAFVGGAASDMGPERGRRHMVQIPAVSKEQLLGDLQRQMAERESKHAAERFHTQAPAHGNHLADAYAEAQGDLEYASTGMPADSLERLLGENPSHASALY